MCWPVSHQTTTLEPRGLANKATAAMGSIEKLATSRSPSVNLQMLCPPKNSRKYFCCSSRRFSILNCLVTALNDRFHLTHRLFIFNKRAGEKSRGQSRGRPRTIMTDGTVNTLSGAVTQTDYVDI